MSKCPNFEQFFTFFQKYFFCKYEVVKCKAWIETYTNALAPDCEDTDDGWIQKLNLLLVYDLTNLVIPRKVLDLDQAELTFLNDSASSSSSSDEGESTIRQTDRVHGKQFKIQRVEKQNVSSVLTADSIYLRQNRFITNDITFKNFFDCFLHSTKTTKKWKEKKPSPRRKLEIYNFLFLNMNWKYSEFCPHKSDLLLN